MHFNEKVENARAVAAAEAQQQQQQQHTIVQQQQIIATAAADVPRNAGMNVTSTPLPNSAPLPPRLPLPNNLALPGQIPLMNSPATVARQLIRDPAMNYASPTGSRNVRFSSPQGLQTVSQAPGGASSTAGANFLPNDPMFPESLLNDSMLMNRLCPNDMEGDASKFSHQHTTISIDIDSDESIGEEAFELFDKLGELKTMKKEKVIKKMKKEAKSVIVIDDQSSEGGTDSVASMHHPPPGPSPLSAETLPNPNPNPVSTAASLPMDLPSDLLPLPASSHAILSQLGAPVTAVSGIADIKMSIAGVGGNVVNGDSVAGDSGRTTTATVIGQIVSAAAETPQAQAQTQRPASRSQ